MQSNNQIAKANENTDVAVVGSDPTPSVLLQLAVQQNLDMDKLEKLMQLQRQWLAHQARKDYLTAFSNFQAKCPVLEKKKKVDFPNKQGGRTKYSYAPIGEITEGIKQILGEEGLSFRWEIDDSETKINVTCIISHFNGHSEKTKMSANLDNSGGKNEIQQRGSTITYLQRYTLIGALGISTADEDNDGHKDETPTHHQRQPIPVKPVNNIEKNVQPAKTNLAQQGAKPWLNPGTIEWDNAFKKIHAGQITMDDVEKNYRISVANHKNLLDPEYVFVPVKKKETA